MTQKKVKKEVFHILSSMGISDKALTGNASFTKDLGLDSLDFAELVMELEVLFNVNIPIVEAGNLQTVQEAVLYINGKLSTINKVHKQ